MLTITSGRASNEAAYLYQLFARHYGTNNFPDCSNMCHEASGIALDKMMFIGDAIFPGGNDYAPKAAGIDRKSVV